MDFFRGGPWHAMQISPSPPQTRSGQADGDQENRSWKATASPRVTRRFTFGTDGADDSDDEQIEHHNQQQDASSTQHAAALSGQRLTSAQFAEYMEHRLTPSTSPSFPATGPSSSVPGPSFSAYGASFPASATTLVSSAADTAHPSNSQPPDDSTDGNHGNDHRDSDLDGNGDDSIPQSTGQTSYAEQEVPNDDLEAVQQAEEGGSIVVDSDDLATDAGYESDTRSSASSSLASSIRNYAFENGRRYHKFREGRYNFPNDDPEQEREDMKHAMLKMLCQTLHFAPLGDLPQEILDIGTGTGIWAIEMGDKFESANVLGIDLSPIQPEWVPPNVRFMVDDVESPWLHPPNHFDYIHSRHTIMAIKDWPQLFRRAIEHLRPGGWMEMQEIHHFPVSSNNTMARDHPVAQFWDLINVGLNKLDVDFKAARSGSLAAMMREAGFVNVVEKVFHVPIGTWPKNKVLKQVGMYWRTILLDGCQAIALGPLTRGCLWSTEQVEVFLVEVRKAYHDNSALMYMPLHVVYGQKPGGA